MKNKVYILSLVLAVLTSLAGCDNDAYTNTQNVV